MIQAFTIFQVRGWMRTAIVICTVLPFQSKAEVQCLRLRSSGSDIQHVAASFKILCGAACKIASRVQIAWRSSQSQGIDERRILGMVQSECGSRIAAFLAAFAGPCHIAGCFRPTDAEYQRSWALRSGPCDIKETKLLPLNLQWGVAGREAEGAVRIACRVILVLQCRPVNALRWW